MTKLCCARFSRFWIRLSNLHISVTETNNLFFALIASLYNKLFTTRNLTFRLVAFHLGLVDLSHLVNPYATSSSNAQTMHVAVAALDPS